MSLFIFTLFVAQLFRVQGIESASMSKQALDSRLAHVTVPALRGQIVSSGGVVLADSVERRTVTADATLTRDYTKLVNGKQEKVGLAGAAQDIAQIVGAKPADLLAPLEAASKINSRFTYVIKDIAPAQWSKIAALGIPGIFGVKTSQREYPQGTSVAPLVGWVSADGTGGGGIEQMENTALNGKPGVHTYEQAPDGTVIASGDNSDTPAVNGKNIKLTIDNDLQWYAQNAMAAAVKKYKAVSADAVVMDLQGNLKAVASYPSFDNNDMASAPNYLQSRPFAEVYAPGSTGKIVTMSALLQQQKATPLTHVVVPPTLTRAGTTFHDSEPHGTENLTLAGVLGESSNMGTMLAGSRISPDTLYSYMRKFGLDRLSGVGFPGESGGILSQPSKWSGTQRYTVLYGQGYAVTAIQQAAVFQTIANGGVREPIKLVSGIGDAAGGWTTPTDSRKAVRVVSPAVAAKVTRMMEGVVTAKGTAPMAAVDGYNVAGKTGTANRYDPQLGRYNGTTASFIGFAPANHPQYIVAITVQDPTRGSIYGGNVAGPVFSQIMSYALHEGHVPPSTTKPAPYPFTFDPSASKKK
ncbi:peptidoglycan D,D-transpeptidase FtsI family protein [Leekyejoonella antrihumi]|uniref:peptidoglycan D,D-transpeptidase FtsI family protein n=1 Tax=Leekyejoonella antrihumi TaxID=1660198 RepID=UPI001FE6B208|nr:penicillin-binding protein 2 [Leekyejoonella antrihumi]